MFFATVTETEGNVPTHQGTTTYVTFVGKGWGRSPKKALTMAHANRRVDVSKKCKLYPFAGTPVLATTVVRCGTKVLIDEIS